MPKESAAEAKRQIQIIDRDLYHLRELQRRYSKRILKMGVMTWVGGIIFFSAAVLVLAGTQIVFQTVNIWIPLLMIALALPILISAVLIRRIVAKEKRLERMRKGLMEKFETAMLKKVGKIVTE